MAWAAVKCNPIGAPLVALFMQAQGRLVAVLVKVRHPSAGTRCPSPNGGGRLRNSTAARIGTAWRGASSTANEASYGSCQLTQLLRQVPT